mgnify:CR=1 FL=1
MIERRFSIRATRLSVIPEGEKLYSEKVFQVEIVDEGAGEFVEITQQSDGAHSKVGCLQIEPVEWVAVKSTVQMLMDDIGGKTLLKIFHEETLP